MKEKLTVWSEALGCNITYRLRKKDMSKADATRLAQVIRDSGKKARVIKQSRGKYAVYAK